MKMSYHQIQKNKYKVIFFNDDATPMEWVIGILNGIFKHSLESAEKLTVQIHTEGSGCVGIYTYEVAEQKTAEAITFARPCPLVLCKCIPIILSEPTADQISFIILLI